MVGLVMIVIAYLLFGYGFSLFAEARTPIEKTSIILAWPVMLIFAVVLVCAVLLAYLVCKYFVDSELD
jgi:hypothetical protein